MYDLVVKAKIPVVKMVEMAKYDTRLDRVDHMVCGDYKRVRVIIQKCPVDSAEGIANDVFCFDDC